MGSLALEIFGSHGRLSSGGWTEGECEGRGLGVRGYEGTDDALRDEGEDGEGVSIRWMTGWSGMVAWHCVRWALFVLSRSAAHS